MNRFMQVCEEHKSCVVVWDIRECSSCPVCTGILEKEKQFQQDLKSFLSDFDTLISAHMPSVEEESDK